MTIIQFIVEMLTRQSDAVAAWVQFIPAALSLVTAGVGAVQEGRKRREMAAKMKGWGADNEAWYNKNYNQDYTQRADSQNVLRQMREEMDRQNKITANTAAITGATNDAVLARKNQNNKTMAGVFSNMAAQGARYKDNVDRQYRYRKQNLEGMEYDELAQSAQSSNQLFQNGISGLAGTDWAGIVGGGNARTPAGSIKAIAAPKQLSGVTVTGGPIKPEKFNQSKG